MKKHTPRCGRILAALIWLLLSAFGTPLNAAETTIVGEVTDTHQIISNGNIYEVGDTEPGDELVYEFVSQKVKVTGTIKEEDGLKVIMVTSFEVVEQ